MAEIKKKKDEKNKSQNTQGRKGGKTTRDIPMEEEVDITFIDEDLPTSTLDYEE